MVGSGFDNLVWCRSWGFLCPVHTPDGEPCGLLNHLTSTCSKFSVPLMCLYMNCTYICGCGPCTRICCAGTWVLLFHCVQSFVKILGEKDCFVTFIDDRTRLSWVYWDEELHDHLQLSFESTN